MTNDRAPSPAPGQPGWKNWLVRILDVGFKPVGLVLAFLHVAAFLLVFDVRQMDGPTSGIMAVVVLVAVFLSVAELSLLHRSLGAGEPLIEFRQPGGKLLLGGMGLALAVAVGLAVTERREHAESEARRQEQEAEAARFRQLRDSPNVQAGAAAMQQWQEVAAARRTGKPATRPQ